jgi:nucleotidyltransferase substrate binding protein (TIGR01987 family)
MTKHTAVISQFEKALRRLEAVLAQPKDEFMRDSSIQRFEFTIDLAWKAIKAHLHEKHGIACASPKSCLREAFKVGIVDHEEKWLSFVDMRNETSHTYNEELAEEVYKCLPDTISSCKKLLTTLKPPIK